LPASILDNMAEVRKIDKKNMLQFCTRMAKHYAESLENADKIKPTYEFPENIIVAGMGGSGIGGELLKDYLRDRAAVSVEVSKDYQLPGYAGKKSLVLLMSYSGETEESLSAFLDAVTRKCMVYCVSSGGFLLKYAEKLNVPYLGVPAGMQPRAALPFLFVPLLMYMERMNIVQGVTSELSEAIGLLEKVIEQNAPEKPVEANCSKTLALNLKAVSPVVYGFGSFRGVAMRWKQQFNENSKVPAKWEVFSELDHNEIVGWENAKKLARNCAAVFIRDNAETMEIRSRIEITKLLIQPTLSKVFEVWTEGKSTLAKMLSAICIGDFTSIYLALLRKVDPTPVKTIAMLKEKLDQNGTRERVIRKLEALVNHDA
jgi:glucose/mannose-6-phosphate isomerase